MSATPCPYCSQPSSNWDGLGENANRIYTCGTVDSTRTTACRTYETNATVEAAEALIIAANEDRVWSELGHGPLASLTDPSE
jgi:hypothetical protein